MAAELDSMAMVTTEICVSLERYSEATVNRILDCDDYLKKIETETNTRIQCDKKGNALFIHGGPRDVKKAYVELHELLKYLSSFKTDASIVDEDAEEKVKLLGKEFISGVIFRKFNDGNSLQENKVSNIYVLDPVRLGKFENGKGRISASASDRAMWDMKEFVEWKFIPEVIREASRVLLAQLRRLSPGTDDNFKLEVSIGKVIFYESSINHPLDSAKFAINDFCHFKETASYFRKYLDTCLIEHLGAVLPKLGYNREGNTFKTIKIQHIVRHKDGDSYINIWSLDIVPGGKDSDKKSRSLELSKVRVLKKSPFSATIHNPANALDFKLSIIANARGCAESMQKIEERVSQTYRYSTKRGLLVNSAVELDHGYKPLVLAESKIFKETAWIRGNIKISVLEVENGPESTFEVKVQNNLLKDYIRESPREVPLEYVIAAVKELFEAVEGIRDELNIFSGSEYPTDYFPKPIQKIEDGSKYSARESRNTFPDIDVEKELRNEYHQAKHTTPFEYIPDMVTPKRLSHSPQRISPRSLSFCGSQITDAAGTYATWEGNFIEDGLDLKIPVLTPTRIHSLVYSSTPDKLSPIEPDLLGEYDDISTSPAPVKYVGSSAIHQAQASALAPYNIRHTMEPPKQIASYSGDPYSTKPIDFLRKIPGALFDIPDYGTRKGPPEDVNCSSRNDTMDPSGTKQIDPFGSICSAADDSEQLVSWSPINRYRNHDEYLGEDLLALS